MFQRLKTTKTDQIHVLNAIHYRTQYLVGPSVEVAAIKSRFVS